MKPPFYAKDMSLEAKTFLYACAFWTVAADENLKPHEQDWLVKQFGPDGVTKSLDEFVALESREFFEAFDRAAAALSDTERSAIYPKLEAWLASCAGVDGFADAAERDTIGKVRERLSLDSEIRRLKDGGFLPAAGSVAAVQPKPSATVAAHARQGLKTEETRSLCGHAADVTGVAISPDGRYVLSGSEDGAVKFWDFEQAAELRTFKGHAMGVTSVCFCRGGNGALSGDRLGELRMWAVDSGKAVWSQDQKRNGGVTGVAVSADGRTAAACSDVGMVVLRDVTQGAEVRSFGERKRGALRAVAFSPDGARVLAGGDDRTIRAWEAATGRDAGVFAAHQDGVMGVGFSPDGRTVVSASRDNTVRLWDAATGSEFRVFKGHTFTVMSACFSPSGRHVLSASWDHTVKVWDVESGRAVVTLESLGGQFSCGAFHPDGRRIAVGGSDKTIYLVNLELG